MSKYLMINCTFKINEFHTRHGKFVWFRLWHFRFQQTFKLWIEKYAFIKTGREEHVQTSLSPSNSVNKSCNESFHVFPDLKNIFVSFRSSSVYVGFLIVKNKASSLFCWIESLKHTGITHFYRTFYILT